LKRNVQETWTSKTNKGGLAQAWGQAKFTLPVPLVLTIGLRMHSGGLVAESVSGVTSYRWPSPTNTVKEAK